MQGGSGETKTHRFEELELLPAIDSVSEVLHPLPSSDVESNDEHLDELPAADDFEPRQLSRSSPGSPASVQVRLHTIRELINLISSDLPVVAVEDGVYRIQQSVYSGEVGSEPSLSKLAASVIGKRVADDWPAGEPDGKSIRLLLSGVDIDGFAGGVPDWEVDVADEFYCKLLIRICRRAGALGAALMVCDSKGDYRLRQAVGLLRRSAATLIFARDDALSTLYFKQRVVLFANGPLRVISGFEKRFSDIARNRIGRFAFLPTFSCGQSSYLLVVARKDEGPWDAATLSARLGLTCEGRSRAGEELSSSVPLPAHPEP